MRPYKNEINNKHNNKNGNNKKIKTLIHSILLIRHKSEEMFFYIVIRMDFLELSR